MAEWSIERLAPHHERPGFDCGNAQLNDWLLTQATQQTRKDLCRAYMAVRPAQVRVLGFYTLSASRMDHSTLPVSVAKKYSPKLELPSILLGRLAVDKSSQGQGLGGILLVNAFSRILLIDRQSGVIAVTVDASDEAARGFYLHFGFQPFLDDPLHLFYTMAGIRKLNLVPLVEPPPTLAPILDPGPVE